MAVVYSVKHRSSRREYVGLTSQSPDLRWQQHRAEAARGGGYLLHAALRKYGAQAFDFKVIATVPTAAEAQIAERLAIAVRQPAYNLTAGGDGRFGYSHSQETRAKISQTHRARGSKPLPPGMLEAAIAYHRGAKRSTSWRKAVSDGLKALHGSTWKDPESRRQAKNARQRAQYAADIEARRRYHRERQRIAQAARPKREPLPGLTDAERKLRGRLKTAAWRAANPDKVRVISDKRNAKKREARRLARGQR